MEYQQPSAAPSSQQQQVVVITQPTSSQAFQPQNIREWSSNICGCFEDCCSCKLAIERTKLAVSVSGYRYLGDSGADCRQSLHNVVPRSRCVFSPFGDDIPKQPEMAGKKQKFWQFLRIRKPFDRHYLENGKSEGFWKKLREKRKLYE